jgi:hypothetical protein
MVKILKLISLSVSILFFENGCSKSNMPVIHPSPGDMSTIEGMYESKHFDLSINKTDAFVYYALENNPCRYSTAGISFVSFGMAKGSNKIEIKAFKPVVKWEIKQLKNNFTTLNDSTVSFELNEPKKLLVTADFGNNEIHNFIVSAEKPNQYKVDKSDKSVLYLGKGVHQKCQAWDPFTNGIKTLYLEGGAVLEATIKTKNQNNIRIIGDGILMQAKWDHPKKASKNLERGWSANGMGTFINNSQNVEVKGIAIMCSPSFQLEIAGCKNVVLDNLKLCAHGEVNNDGIHAYGSEIEINDCFIAASDDRICIAGRYDLDNGQVFTNGDSLMYRMTDCISENNTIKNCVFWGIQNGGDLMLSWNTSLETRKIVVENCESLTPVNKGFLSAKFGGSGHVRDITIRNCHLYHPDLFAIEIVEASCFGYGGGKISDIMLENITIDAEPEQVGKYITGKTESSNIYNIVLKNVTANGKKLTSRGSTKIKLNEFAKEPIFE